MKIWNNFGTEHSYSLVMIGTFKEESEAERVKNMIERLESELPKLGVEGRTDRYSEEVMELLQELKCTNIAPYELEQLLYDRNMSIDGKKLSFTTDEIDISALIKLMIDSGAKVELFERQYYED